MHEMYAPEEHKEKRLCVSAGDGCGHSSYYLLGWLLLSADFGSVGTDSSSPCNRQSMFAVELCLILIVLLHQN